MPTFTMRMPEKDYETLQAMALLTRKSMAELVREAIVLMVTRYLESGDIERQIDDEADKRKAALRSVKLNLAAD
jgi:hypothetical protein